ncbi:MAG: hypothetical protein IT532_07490 [Burkholderiales bacterium]|nr:hypothetical protein [Burkholderiales bacterium]
MSAASAATQDSWSGEPFAALAARYADALDAGQESALREALGRAPSPGVWRDMAAALEQAMEPEPGGLATRLFAIPVAIVAGGRAGVRIPATLPDVERLRDVLRGSGALGPVTNFGTGNALCGAGALEGLSWARLRRFARATDEAAAGDGWFELPPDDLILPGQDESVHLRFLAGAAVSPANASTFLETASAISTWGVPFTRELSAQLQGEGTSVVAIPRPPAAILRAIAAGSAAEQELGLQAFVSRALRRFRSETGEPDVSVAALTGGAVGLRFASPFAENRVDVHERRLHPCEDWDAVLREILQLLEDCRVGNVHVVARVSDPEQFRAGRFSPH